MSTRRSHLGTILFGALLIGLGILFLLGQVFPDFDFWDTFWPFFLIGIGLLFFVGMLVSGRSAAGLAIPGAIITMIGLMMFIQNLFDRWESWAYGWTVILFSVGLGIYIKGVYGRQESSRQSGARLMRLGFILFIIFGLFFEMIFSFESAARFVFPVALILLGLYLLVIRSGMLPARRRDIPTPVAPPPQAEIPTPIVTPPQPEALIPEETLTPEETPPESDNPSQDQ